MDAAQGAGAYTPMGGEAEELYQRFVDLGGGEQGLFRHHQDDRRQLEGARAAIGEIMRNALIAVAASCSRCVRQAGSNCRPTRRKPERAPRPPTRPAPCSVAAGAGPAAKALKIMHERHEGMEADRQGDKDDRPRAQAATPDVAAVARRPRRPSPTLRAKSPAWFPAGTGPDVGKTGAKPEIWQKPGISPPRTRRSRRPRRRSTRPPQAATASAIKAGFARPRQDLQGVPRQISRRDEALSDGRALQAAGLGPADPAVPLAAGGLIAFSWWSAE